VRFAAADIAAHRGPAQETDKSADRSRKNNPRAEDGRIEKVLIDPIVAGGCDKPLDNVIPSFFADTRTSTTTRNSAGRRLSY